MEEKVYLTKEGMEKLRGEFNSLKEKERPETVERLALARMQGDLSENTEYAAARDALAFIDGRIEEIEEILKNAVLVEEKSGPKESVDVGCKVTVRTNGSEHIYQIVGEWEADPSKKKVSPSSPLGQALIGRKAGEEVEFEAPAGKVIFTVVRID
jgi:transcription elongation factor GreA